MVGKFLPPQIGSFTKIPAEEADQFFSQHPIIYRPTHRKNRTPTGGVSPFNHSLFRDPPKAGSPKGYGNHTNKIVFTVSVHTTISPKRRKPLTLYE